jgi:hypothetical protein
MPWSVFVGEEAAWIDGFVFVTGIDGHYFLVGHSMWEQQEFIDACS